MRNRLQRRDSISRRKTQKKNEGISELWNIKPSDCEGR